MTVIEFLRSKQREYERDASKARSSGERSYWNQQAKAVERMINMIRMHRLELDDID